MLKLKWHLLERSEKDNTFQLLSELFLIVQINIYMAPECMKIPTSPWP